MNIDRRTLFLPALAIGLLGVVPAFAASADEDAVAKNIEAFAVLIHEFNVAVTDDVEKIPAHPHTPQHSRSQPIARLNRLSRCMCQVERSRTVASGRALTEMGGFLTRPSAGRHLQAAPPPARPRGRCETAGLPSD